MYSLWFSLVKKAAAEKVSTLHFTPEGANSIIDLRKIRLEIQPPENDYNPKKHRHPKPEIVPWMAYFNLLRTVLGPGVLGMPVAISASGLLIGTTFTVLIAIAIIHTHHLLLVCLNNIAKQLKIPYVSYRYGFRLALLHGPPIWHCIGRHGSFIIATFMFLSQLGICTINVIMTADSLRDIIDCESSISTLLGLFPCYLLMEFFMKNLKRITYVALFATFLNMLGLVLLLYYIFKEPIKEIIWHEPDVAGWMFTSGMCLFNFSAFGVIIAIEKSLREPEHMIKPFGVINIGIGVPAMLSLLIGILGFWAFGSMEENCLRSLPYEEILAMVTIAAYMVSMALSYPLQCYPAIAMLTDVIKYHGDELPRKSTLNLVELIARPIFVAMSFFIAYNVPFQGPFVAFVGSLCTSMMAAVFPVMMDISLRYDVPGAYGRYRIILIKDLLILICSLLCSIFGIYFCGYLIYIRLLSANSPNSDIFF